MYFDIYRGGKRKLFANYIQSLNFYLIQHSCRNKKVIFWSLFNYTLCIPIRSMIVNLIFEIPIGKANCPSSITSTNVFIAFGSSIDKFIDRVTDK